MTKRKFKKNSELIFFFLKGSIRYFVLGILMAAIMAFLELINPKIIGYTVDSVIGSEVSSLPKFVNTWITALGGREYFRSHLYMIGVIVVVTALFAALSRFLNGYFNAQGAERLVKKMRDSLYEHIMYLPYSWHGENQTGDIIQRCTSDVETIKRFLSEQLTGLFRILILIVMSLYFMFRINVKLTFAAAALIPVIVIYSLVYYSKIGASFEKVDTEEGRLSAIAQENLTGVRVVRAFGRESYERARFEKKNEEYTGLWVYMMKLLSGFWASNDLISGIQILMVVAFGSYLAVKGEITTGSYIAFVSYNAMLTWPVRSLGRMISELSKAGISVSRIMFIMNSETEKEPEEGTPFPAHADVSFSHVSFAFENEGGKILDDVSLEIPEGKTIGILGGTGSGKSTLVQLLDHLYDVTDGEITIGGVNVMDIKSLELRKNIGLVLQEPYLFSRTLGENIKICKEDATDAELHEACVIACLDGTIQKFTEGFDTMVGERGVTLSGGQKQRTAIAQMLIRKPKIMIFDDSLSAVDAETDSKIRHAIQKYTKDATVILISHRITTLMHADEIYVLEDGHVAESGNHDELYRENGIYRKIYDLQLSGREEE